jgi:hypothetical protein
MKHPHSVCGAICPHVSFDIERVEFTGNATPVKTLISGAMSRDAARKFVG